MRESQIVAVEQGGLYSKNERNLDCCGRTRGIYTVKMRESQIVAVEQGEYIQ